MTQPKTPDKKWMHTQVGTYFAEKRIAAGKTQNEVAQFLGVHAQYISNSERGTGSLSNVFIKKLLGYYKIDPNDFFEFSLELYEIYLKAQLGIKKVN